MYGFSIGLAIAFSRLQFDQQHDNLQYPATNALCKIHGKRLNAAYKLRKKSTDFQYHLKNGFCTSKHF